jgi:uncharacterized membrane protein
VYLSRQKEVEVGDRVLLHYSDSMETYFFVEYIRIGYMVIFGSVLFVLIILFAGIKGLNSIVSLCFTCMAIGNV